MRIDIIGAGIAGLSAAAGLLRRGHEVTVFERAHTPAATGAGLTLFGNAFEALDFLGIGEQIRSISSGAMASMTSGQRRPDGSWIKQVPPCLPINHEERAPPGPSRPAHRLRGRGKHPLHL